MTAFFLFLVGSLLVVIGLMTPRKPPRPVHIPEVGATYYPRRHIGLHDPTPSEPYRCRAIGPHNSVEVVSVDTSAGDGSARVRLRAYCDPIGIQHPPIDYEISAQQLEKKYDRVNRLTYYGDPTPSKVEQENHRARL